MKHKIEGGIVATQHHGLTSWWGKTERFWVTTDVDPKTIKAQEVADHIVEISKEQFEGSFWITAFTKDQPSYTLDDIIDGKVK